MATVSVDVPTALVVPLGKALAFALGEDEPANNAERLDVAQRFMKSRAKQALMDYRAQQAALASREDDSDGSVSW